jgi:hypothetical protein
MSQQRDDSGAYSVPQKLVQLVGCLDPKATGPKPVNSKPVNSKPARSKPEGPKARTQLKR